MASSDWHTVSRNEPCPCCNRTDWCAVANDGAWAICRRNTGVGEVRTDAAGAEYWLHKLTEGAERPRWDPRPPAVAIAPAADRDRVYGRVLAELPLSDAHRQALRARGLSDFDVDAGGYRSLGVTGRARLVHGLAERFGTDLLMGIPGIQLRETGDRRWLTMGGAAGLVIPVRDLGDRVVALKVRADNPLEPSNRYMYVSSRSRGGPGPGSPVHVPTCVPRACTEVRITEGELKADVATLLSGVATISAPSVNTWRATIPVLQEMGATTVRLALDGDWRTNDHVRSMVVAAAAELGQHFDGGIEVWRPGEGKGIDDVVAHGGATRVVPFERGRELERPLDRSLSR